EINDILHIQDALQGLVAQEGAVACDRTGAAAITKALERLRAAQTPRQIFVATWEVDRQIAKAGNNKVLAEMYCAIVDMIESSVDVFDVDVLREEGPRRINEVMAVDVIAIDVKAASVA